MKCLQPALIGLIVAGALAGCTKVGSPEWCEDMDAKSKGEWTANEAGDYAKYCVMGLDPDKS